jgi:hypothetical protein
MFEAYPGSRLAKCQLPADRRLVNGKFVLGETEGMASKLEMAQKAVDELKKAIANGEDISADAKGVDLALMQAQIDALDGKVAQLQKAEEPAKSDEKKDDKSADDKKEDGKSDDKKDEKKDDKKEPEKEDKQEDKNDVPKLPEEEAEDGDESSKEDDEMEETKAAKLLDLALEEIVSQRGEIARLQKDMAGLGMGKEKLPDTVKDKGAESAGKGKDSSIEPGPQGDLKKPESTDYSASAEVKKAADEIESRLSAKFEGILKSAGIVASTTPVPAAIAGSRSANVGGDDLTKAVEWLCRDPDPPSLLVKAGKIPGATFKQVNKFRSQVDPALQSLDMSRRAY